MQTPHILIQDNNSHWYLIPEESQIGFLRWVEACESGKFSLMKKFDKFNNCRVELSKLRILEWEDTV
jgi:hypothetical protein